MRRRWRALGLILVLLAGSLFVLVVTDRGHDPLWDARGSALIDQAVPAPDGKVVYSLVRENGAIARLEARSGASGVLLWDSPMNATRALLATGGASVAVATDFPRAFLTVYGDDGTIRMQVALEGNPRALVLDASRTVLALQAPRNPVSIYEDGKLARTLHFESFVNSLDLRAGRLAVGTGNGNVVVLARNAEALLNQSLPLSVHSLRLDRDGTTLLVGGSSLRPGDLSGAVAFLDLGNAKPLRWSHNTSVGVSLVDLDDAGILALAVEESLPKHTITMYDGGTGTLRWSQTADGIVPRDDAGAFGGAALSPDGAHVIVATLRGAVQAYAATSGKPEWTFGSEGSSVVSFARAAPDLFIADGRLSPNGPYDSLFLFSATQEPARGRLPELGALLVLASLVAASAVLGVGYWRLRRSY